LVRFSALLFVHRFAARYALQWCSVHTGCLNAVVSIGSFRKRLPVAAKIALVTAGTIAEVPGSPIPPGGSELWTMWTSMRGVLDQCERGETVRPQSAKFAVEISLPGGNRRI
jgi:hypothetical protein